MARQDLAVMIAAVEPRMDPIHTDEDTLNRLSQRVIGCALTVASGLGVGFSEKVYENSLAHELRKAGLAVPQRRGISVWYDGVNVGDYSVDLLVEEALLVELKAVKLLDDSHRTQCLNYLKATGLRLCLLLNFGAPRLEIKRVVLRL
jgi:GxxExxY protein